MTSGVCVRNNKTGSRAIFDLHVFLEKSQALYQWSVTLPGCHHTKKHHHDLRASSTTPKTYSESWPKHLLLKTASFRMFRVTTYITTCVTTYEPNCLNQHNWESSLLPGG